MRPGHFLAAALTLAPFLATGVALAQPVQPLDRLLPQIRRTHPGQFFNADGPVTGADGLQHYHLEWMTPDGRILWLDTDARTGRVLSLSPGRDSFDGRQGASRMQSAPRMQGAPRILNAPRNNERAPNAFGPGAAPQGPSRFAAPYGGPFAGGGQTHSGDRSIGRGRAPNGR